MYSMYIGETMTQQSTILLEKETIENLKKAKEYPRQTYDALVKEMTAVFLKLKKQQQRYDLFLHKIQQPKMKELWDNKEDEAWERA